MVYICSAHLCKLAWCVTERYFFLTTLALQLRDGSVCEHKGTVPLAQAGTRLLSELIQVDFCGYRVHVRNVAARALAW